MAAESDHKRRPSLLDVPIDERPENASGYKAPPKVGVDDLLKKDADDVALQKYKESLLGTAGGNKNKYPNDPRTVIVEEFGIVFTGHGPVSFNPNSGKPPVIRIKEASNYRVKIRFYCQHQLVSGLKYMNFVYKHGVRIDKSEETLGSYAPQLNAYECLMEEETAPDGWLARGNYTAKCRLVDDDMQIHSEIEYAFEITSDW